VFSVLSVVKNYPATYWIAPGEILVRFVARVEVGLAIRTSVVEEFRLLKEVPWLESRNLLCCSSLALDARLRAARPVRPQFRLQ
jgi:hypothetical protein